MLNTVIFPDKVKIAKVILILLNADEASFCPNDVEYHLNIELNKINEWVEINKLSLNVKTSKYIIYNLGNKQVKNLFLKIDQTVIERVQNVNMLGVTLQENLNCDVHIQILQLKVPN